MASGLAKLNLVGLDFVVGILAGSEWKEMGLVAACLLTSSLIASNLEVKVCWVEWH